MYYSMIGTLVTIFFGLLISWLSDVYTRNKILRLRSSADLYDEGFNVHMPRHFTSFTATGRKLSALFYHVAHDVSQSTLKVENKLKEVISYSNLHHGGVADERISILNEEDDDEQNENTIRELPLPMPLPRDGGKMFFIGSRRVSFA
jgi:hypothetical protein